MRIPRELLREVLVISDLTGAGAHGNVYTAGRTVRGAFQQTSRLVSDSQGRQVSLEALVLIRPEDGPVTVESKVGIWGQTFRVIQCQPMPDSRRPSHYELSLARYAG